MFNTNNFYIKNMCFSHDLKNNLNCSIEDVIVKDIDANLFHSLLETMIFFILIKNN